MRGRFLLAAVAALVVLTALPGATSAWPVPSPPPTEPVVRDPAANAPITAASVVQHYVDVGRKIRLFAQDRGASAASKLWELFRYIRINDAVLDPAKRNETDARLRRIEDSLAAGCPR